MKKQHYGIQVDSEVPTTGVFTMNDINQEFFESEDFIDLAWEEHIEKCENNDHDECYVEHDRYESIIGFRKGKNGVYEVDQDAEYSAIIRENTIQVIRSIWGIKGALCSPCFPGQVDTGTKGEFLAYSLPYELLNEDVFKNRVFRLNEEG